MKSFILIVGSATLVAGLGYWLMPTQSDSPVHSEELTEGAHATQAVAPSVTGPASTSSLPVLNVGTEADLGQQVRGELARDRRFQYLQQLQAEGGNLQQWFNELLQRCGAQVAACQSLLEQELEGYPDGDFTDQLRALLPRYLGYDQAMSALVMSRDLSPRTRYQRVDALRVEHLGDAGAELMFGQERAWADYRFGYEALLAKAPSLSSGERLQALDQLRQQSWQDHYEALSGLEGRHGAYQREKEVLLLGVTDRQQREALAEELRTRHFGEQEAEFLALREVELNLQQQQREGYQQARAELEQSLSAQRSLMSEQDWQQQYQEQLQKLRQDWFSEPAN